MHTNINQLKDHLPISVTMHKLPSRTLMPQAIGHLQPSAATSLGLPPGLSVSPGSGDNAMSALGAGVVEPGQLVVSLGTSGTVFGVAPQPILDPSGAICPFCDATGAGLPLLCTLNCTVPPQEVCA